MPNMKDPNELSGGLLHFHVCRHCESALRREVFEGRALTPGIYGYPIFAQSHRVKVGIRAKLESSQTLLLL